MQLYVIQTNTNQKSKDPEEDSNIWEFEQFFEDAGFLSVVNIQGSQQVMSKATKFEEEKKHAPSSKRKQKLLER